MLVLNSAMLSSVDESRRRGVVSQHLVQQHVFQDFAEAGFVTSCSLDPLPIAWSRGYNTALPPDGPKRGLDRWSQRLLLLMLHFWKTLCLVRNVSQYEGAKNGNGGLTFYHYWC